MTGGSQNKLCQSIGWLTVFVPNVIKGTSANTCWLKIWLALLLKNSLQGATPTHPTLASHVCLKISKYL